MLLKVISIVSLKLVLNVTHSAILNKLASAVIRLTIRESLSGKVTIGESSFRKNDYPGIVFPGNVSSGKMTIRESYYPGNDCKTSGISASCLSCRVVS